MADVNPFDALDEAPSTPPTAPPPAAAPQSSANPFDALDEDPNPFDAMDSEPASAATKSRMDDVLDQTDIPEVTVTGKKPQPEASWSDVAAGISPAIGAGIETKLAGRQEYMGKGVYDDARRKLWQSIVLPEAVRNAQKAGIALTEDPAVQSAAAHLGIRPDTLTKDWPTYVNQSDAERQDFQAQQRARLSQASDQIASGTKRRQTAAQVSAGSQPQMDEYSPKRLAFSAATMIPDLLVGIGATVATGPIGGAAAMMADIAPQEYADARNKGLSDRKATTYAMLTTLASSVPELPVLKIVENTPAARKIISTAVGEKLAGTFGGKVAGTAVTQGVTQSLIQALQIGIDQGILDEQTSLPDALKRIAFSGATGALVGAPIGAGHAAQHRFSEAGRLQADLERTRQKYPQKPFVGPYEPIGVQAGVLGFGSESRNPKPITFRDFPHPGETPPEAGAVEAPAAAGGPSSESAGEASQEGNRAGEANPEAEVPRGTQPDESAEDQRLNGEVAGEGDVPVPMHSSDEHTALQAVLDKTVSPAQLERLEAAKLATRNDVNVPRLLPAGRRRLVELKKVQANDAERTAQQSGAGEAPAEAPPATDGTPQADHEAQAGGKPGADEGAKPVRQPAAGLAAASDRLKTDQDLRAGLTAMKQETGWAQVGGRVIRDATSNEVTGRTSWIPNADWWQNRPKGLKENEVHDAVDKALAGRPLKKPEQRIVDFMVEVHDERTAMHATHAELQKIEPDLHTQPEGALDLTLLASQAAEHDANAAAAIMDTWNDDEPATIARLRGEFERIIGRGKETFLTAQDGRSGEPAKAQRAPAALDLFGEDRSKEQALADETARRDAARSPNRDVSIETGNPNDLFSQARKQVDVDDESTASRSKQRETVEEAGGFKKGGLIRINAPENAEHGNRAKISSLFRHGKDEPFMARVQHEAGGEEIFDLAQLEDIAPQGDFLTKLEEAREKTNAAPSDAQKLAGNYSKGTLDFGGMPLAIENPKGSQRTGVSSKGEKWSRKMHADYGYVKGTEGKDGDAVDVFLTGKPDTGKVFVINQVHPDGTFDEHKAVLGAETAKEAETLYRKHYPKDWKGMGSMAELSTPDFKKWVNSPRAKRPIRPTERLERRENAAERARVKDMTPEQLRQELMTHELTGIPNRRAYTETEKLPHQVSIDVDSLKWVNDNMGHESGNELLKAIASSLSSHSDNVFHLSGDEFAVQARTEAEAHAVMAKVADHLKNASIEVEMPDGKVVTLKGMGVSYGVGKDLHEADTALQSHKSRREAEGTRAARGEAPPGSSIGSREAGRPDQARGAPEGVAKKKRTPRGASSQEPKSIEDAGEKIGGARKDVWAQRGMELKDLDSMTDSEAATLVTKKNVWTPDYEKMIADGAEPLAAAMVKVLYDKLAATPRNNTPEGRRQYIQMMRAVREHMDGAKTAAEVKAAEEKIAQAVGYGRYERGDAIARVAMQKGMDTFFSVIRGRRSTLRMGYAEQKAAAELIAKGFPNTEAWHSRVEIKDATASGLTDKGWEYLSAEAEKLGTPLLSRQDAEKGLFRVRLKNGRTIGYTHTKGGAEALARSLYTALKSKKDEGDVPDRPHLDELTRTGLPSTRARDVQSDDFLKDFGFRGIEFGNWAAGDERQKLVNLAYDGLHDMAAALHISPQALSLNGTLGLAFGARGKGRASAHYEPGKLVINMTKINGAGSLAHEWAHALDHYFGELDRPNAYTTDARGASGWYGRQTTKGLENLRPEMKEAWSNVIKALFQRNRTKAESVRQRELNLERQEADIAKGKEQIAKAQAREPSQQDPTYEKRMIPWLAGQEKVLEHMREDLAKARGEEEKPPGGYGTVESSYFKEASKLSGKSAEKGYWTRPTEMWARAFEAFVFDHLKDQGASSEYLVHGVEPDRYASDSYKGNPYPVEDRPAINAAIQHLVDTMSTREGTSGLPTLYRRREGFETGLPAAHVERVVRSAVREAHLETAPGFPHVEVHEDISTLPEHIRNVIVADQAETRTGAVYDPNTGRIHLIADNNGSEQEVRENLWHEAVGHHGLRLAMDPPQYAAIMDGINRDMPERVQAAAQRNGLDMEDLRQRRAAAEEVIAYAAGQHLSGQPIDKPVIPYWTKALRAMKAFFARMTGKPFFDDKAIAGLIQQARTALERGTAGTELGEPARSTRAPTFYSPVERAVTESKQGKASADQWLATIKKAPGIKPEELEWLDLEKWLKEHQGPITKEELSEYVRANKLEVQETLQGDPAAREQTENEKLQIHLAEALRAEGHRLVFDQDNGALLQIDYRHPEGQGLSHEIGDRGYTEFNMGDGAEDVILPPDIHDRAMELWRVNQENLAERAEEQFDAQDMGPGGTQYGEYTLPGGQNYRELLLRLPVKQEPSDEVRYVDRTTGRSLFTMRAGEDAEMVDARERSNGARMEPIMQERPDYRSGHWSEPNIVAHARFKERTDADGKKVLFIEEIQSDWHQAGRQRGYRSDLSPEDHQRLKELDARIARLREYGANEKEREEYFKPGALVFGYGGLDKVIRYIPEDSRGSWSVEVIRVKPDGSPMPGEGPRLHSTSPASAMIEELAREARKLDKGNLVPDAPFKTTWPMLTMKRMIRWAAENGFDRIAWTTGDQQNERYNLAQHIDSITYSQDADGKYWLYIAKDGRSVAQDLQHVAMSEQELKDAVGQEMAQKMINGEGKITSIDPNVKLPERELSGLDLRVGGEGMRGFYDQILPRETDKLIKKFGGKVGPAKVSATAGAEKSYYEGPQRTRAEVLHLTNPQTVPGGRGGDVYQELMNVASVMDSGGTFQEAVDQEGGPESAKVLGGRIAEPPVMADAHGFDLTPEMKQAALGQGFPMFARRQLPLTLEHEKEKGAYALVRRAATAVIEARGVRELRALVHPAGMSQVSRQVANIATESLGKLAHDSAQSQEALEQFSRIIDKQPVVEKLAMMHAIEMGEPQPNPEMQPIADAMRKMLDDWRDKVRGLGEGYLDNFIENYFPHYWNNEGEAARLVASIMGRRPLRGPATFLKMRTIPTIKEGMDAGLKPLTVNPLIMTLLKTREMQRFVSGVTLMRRFQEDGIARFLKTGHQMPDGWAPINDSIAKVRTWSEEAAGFIDRGQYIMPIDGARVINNHVSASVFRDSAFVNLFRMGSGMLNALQLGFSAFHLGFTTLDAMISKNALAIERMAHGEVGKAMAAFAEAFTPVGAVTNVRRGYQLLNAYMDPAGATPELQRLVRMLEMGGGRVHMDRYFQLAQGVSPFRSVGVRSLANDIRLALTAPTDKLSHLAKAAGDFPKEYATALLRSLQALTKTHTKLQIPFEVAGRVVRASTSWIMEHVVPMQKLGVFSDLASDHLRRHPFEDPNDRAMAMQKIWRSVDNRLGEMVYDNKFWNRTFKDILHLGIRAVGWNAGTIEEIGGAPVDVVKLINKAATTGRITADDLGHKIPYVMAMTMTTAMLGATLTYMFTGRGPQELKDYFFPPTGGITNFGTPQRVSMPSYAKDVYEYSQHPGRTVLNKLNPIFSLAGDIWSNEDFFGTPIADPEGTGPERAWQKTKFVWSASKPFSFQGRQQLAGSEKPGMGGSVRKTLPLIGITPAPGYITSGEQMERRERLAQDVKYISNLKYKMKKAYADGDKVTGEEYKNRWVEATKRMNQTKIEVMKDKAKAAAGRRKAAISMRQAGYPATAELVASLPLEPDESARQYFKQHAETEAG